MQRQLSGPGLPPALVQRKQHRSGRDRARQREPDREHHVVGRIGLGVDHQLDLGVPRHGHGQVAVAARVLLRRLQRPARDQRLGLEREQRLLRVQRLGRARVLVGRDPLGHVADGVEPLGVELLAQRVGHVRQQTHVPLGGRDPRPVAQAALAVLHERTVPARRLDVDRHVLDPVRGLGQQRRHALLHALEQVAHVGPVQLHPVIVEPVHADREQLGDVVLRQDPVPGERHVQPIGQPVVREEGGQGARVEQDLDEVRLAHPHLSRVLHVDDPDADARVVGRQGPARAVGQQLGSARWIEPLQQQQIRAQIHQGLEQGQRRVGRERQHGPGEVLGHGELVLDQAQPGTLLA